MTNNANIIYKDIPGYDGLYRVSNFGDVISCSRDVFTGSGDKEELLSSKKNDLIPLIEKVTRLLIFEKIIKPLPLVFINLFCGLSLACNKRNRS